MSLSSFLMRLGCARSDRKRDRGLTVPPGLSIHKNIPYGRHRKQLLDVYKPANCREPLPVIVSVHGGGWVYGDKELYSHYCMDLATRGFAVVNFTYRLSPEHKFPCHLEDTALAFRWVRQHHAQYGMDPKNVFAVGDSAGGHLLALYCCLCVNPACASAYPFHTPDALLPRAVALNCGVYDFLAVKNANSNTLQLIKDVLGHPASDAELQTLSPLYHVAAGFPPSYIMTANEDFLKDQSLPLMQALEALQVPCAYRCYGDDDTKLGHVFHLDIRHSQAIACNDAQCAFFLAHRRPPREVP